MEQSKLRIVRTKSSSSISSSNISKDMKCRSNTTLRTNLAKRRGVYVERKTKEPAKTPSDEPEDKEIQKEPIKAPKRPSRGQKMFLNSVLSLLSKSSTGTQYPDIPDVKPRIKKLNRTDNKNKTLETDKRKKKFKSKVLNSCNYPPDTFEVLQHKKNIITTPSIGFSEDDEKEDIKWAEFLPRLVKPDSEEIKMERDKKLSFLAKEVAEGRMEKEKRVIVDADEPPTLVSDNKKMSTKDPRFYNFFVNLLETSFSVYNIKSQCNCHSADHTPGSSKVAFEMDEKVATKLKVKPEISRQTIYTKNRKESRKEQLEDYFNFQLCPPRQFNNPPLTKKKPQVLMRKQRTPKQHILLPHSVSMRSPSIPKKESMTQKSFYKKNSKQILLSMLKEQLRMDNLPSEEPQNLFQALRVIAKNKQKSLKSLRFEKAPTVLTESMFRTRRLIPKRSKLKGHSPKTLPSARSSLMRKQQNRLKITDDNLSNHSLEVFNINYDKYKNKRRTRPKGTVENYSPTFSPTESVDNIYGKSYTPIHNRVVMSVKPLISKSSSRSFCYGRDGSML